MSPQTHYTKKHKITFSLLTNSVHIFDSLYFCNTVQQGMTYYVKFIIIKKDCLVMKKIGNRPITEADTDFSKIRTEF